MSQKRFFKKTKPGKPIPVTARQLESFMLKHNGRFNSRDYDKFERMELMESPVRDAIHELKTYSLETLAQRFDVRLLGRGKRVFARLDAEDSVLFDIFIIHFLLSVIIQSMKRKTDIDSEAIRLAIQAGIVASCLVVISGDYGILTIEFQLFVKLLALILGLLSMSYIILTARLFGFKDKKDLITRKWIYDNSITFYWYIFATILYYFTGDFFATLFEISPVIVYISTLVIATIVVAILFTVYLCKKKKK